MTSHPLQPKTLLDPHTPMPESVGLGFYLCNVGLALVRRGTIMRCSGNPIGDPPLFRVVLNYAMFAGRG